MNNQFIQAFTDLLNHIDYLYSSIAFQHTALPDHATKCVFPPSHPQNQAQLAQTQNQGLCYQYRDLPGTWLLCAVSFCWHRQHLPCVAPNTVSLTWDMALLLSNAAYERKAVHREQPARKHLRPVLIPTYLHLFTK